jgi:hypothetical protein
MPGFPVLSVRQPQPFDIVDEPVEVAGVGTAFEAVAQARLRDGNGVEIVSMPITVGGTGTWANFRFSIAAGGVAPTPQGTRWWPAIRSRRSRCTGTVTRRCGRASSRPTATRSSTPTSSS